VFRRKYSAVFTGFCLFFGSCVYGGRVLAQEEAFRAYYQGLKTLEEGETAGENRAWPFFETALTSANSRIAEAAAAELILPLLRGDADAAAFLDHRYKGRGDGRSPPLRTAAAAALYGLGRWEEIAAFPDPVLGKERPQAGDSAGLRGILGSWERVLILIARQHLVSETEEELKTSGTVSAENPGPLPAGALLSCLLEIPPGPPLSWAAEELRLCFPDLLNGVHKSALEGRLAAARSSFARGLALFRSVLDEEPELFLQFPALITDLGRCFQFGASGDGGIEIFLAWERRAASPALRYRLLYYAGRMARAQGDYRLGAGLFERALAFAPDESQEDACLWYILDARLREESGGRGGLSGSELVDLVKTWIPRGRDPSYFSDILDRVAQRLASSGQWRFFPELLAFLEQYGDPLSTAQYAYISGRALSIGLIPGETPVSGRTGNHGENRQEEEVRRLFRTAYNSGTRALYYRAMGAYFLGEPFLDLEGESPARTRNFPHQEEMSFLLGFFEEGLSGAAEIHVEALAGELTLEELQALGEAMEAAGAYTQAVRTASSFVNREDYRLRRRDLELLSPRPFRDLIEEQARGSGLAPELFYGLIRTESAFQPEIASRAGAVGLTQLMPATAADMADRMRRRGGPDYTENLDLENPEINTAVGAYYLNYLQNLLEHPLLAILAYNGGLSRVRRWYRAQPGLPGDLFLETVEFPETREYGRRLISSAALYGYLYYGVNPPPFLADICR
jgi:soluble lytic murein transglycosylase